MIGQIFEVVIGVEVSKTTNGIVMFSIARQVSGFTTKQKKADAVVQPAPTPLMFMGSSPTRSKVFVTEIFVVIATIVINQVLVLMMSGAAWPSC